jgi:hypothetical protein
MGDKSAYEVLVGGPEGKRPLRRREDYDRMNVKLMG